MISHTCSISANGSGSPMLLSVLFQHCNSIWCVQEDLAKSISSMCVRANLVMRLVREPG